MVNFFKKCNTHSVNRLLGERMGHFVFFLGLLTLFVSCDRSTMSVNKTALEIKSSPIIYGNNDILDYHEVRGKRIRQIGRSVAIQIPEDKLEYANGHYTINQDLLEDLNICPEHDAFHEKISAQPSLGTCSGFLIEEDVLLTASHCVESLSDCEENFWAFDFKSDPQNIAPSNFKATNVHKCIEIIDQNKSLDYAILKLDRPVLGRKPLQMRQRGKILKDSKLVVVGYPQGLPLKFSTNAKIRDNKDEDQFIINSDTFEGNSGSPVVNTKNYLVEGVLVRGGTDFDLNEKSNDQCYTIKRCPEGQCSGEEILRIKSIFEKDL